MVFCVQDFARIYTSLGLGKGKYCRTSRAVCVETGEDRRGEDVALTATHTH